MSVSGHEDAHQEGLVREREMREQVADQLHDLVVERADLGSLDEIARRFRQVAAAWRRVVEARGRQAQAEEFGLPRAPQVKAEFEALDLLRQSVMSLGEACGSVVVGMDVERAGRLG